MSRVFVAGATGATGVVLVPRLRARGHTVIPHVRPATAARHPLGQDPGAAVLDLADGAALDRALAGCDAVVSLVGTMRERFSTGDTYAASDVGTTRLLVEAARRVGAARFVLLSSYGAGGAGPYLQAKGDAERIVQEGGLTWTLVRPSALVSPTDGMHGSHGRRRTPSWLVGLGAQVARLPLVGPTVDDLRAIPIEVVSDGIVAALEDPSGFDGRVLAGRDLWSIVTRT
jgi:nucleoside-diphosphate-sugar epimerase